MNKKVIKLVQIIIFLGLCFFIFAGASCNINEKILNGANPTSLTAKDAVNAVKNVAEILAGAASTFALAFIIYGGFQFITSAGNDEQMGKAKNTLTYAIVGLILIIISYALVTYFLQNVLAK